MRTNFSTARKAKVRNYIKEHEQRCAKQMLLEKTEAKTNADRIRAMSDEELANIMAGTPICKERYMDCLKDGRDCEPCLLEWLKQPAE